MGRGGGFGTGLGVRSGRRVGRAGWRLGFRRLLLSTLHQSVPGKDRRILWETQETGVIRGRLPCGQGQSYD